MWMLTTSFQVAERAADTHADLGDVLMAGAERRCC
jgi:hypothetical protein